jgi:hypothetical protein
VHVLCAYGGDVRGEAARVRGALYSPPAWEARLEGLLACHGEMLSAPGADSLLCPCGQQHPAWSGLWPAEAEAGEAEAEAGEAEAGAAGAGGCLRRDDGPPDDVWYQQHRSLMEQLQVRWTGAMGPRWLVEPRWQGCH